MPLTAPNITEPPPVGRQWPRVAAVLAATLLLVAYLVRGLFSSGYTEGSDTLAHLFRIQQMSAWLRHPGGLFDWTDAWYGGFHQFALYPYLTYLPAAALDAVSGSPFVSMKLVMLGAILAGAAGVYGCLIELTRDQVELAARLLGAAGGAVIFALSPAFLGLMFGYGEYSDFVAIGFGPVVLLGLLLALRHDSSLAWVGYGIALALLLLMHPHVGLSALIGHAAYLFFSPQPSVRAALGAVYATCLAVLLSLFFWLPFLYLRDSAGDPSLGTLFTDPVWAIEFGDYASRDLALRYLGVAAAGLAVAGVFRRESRRAAIPIAAMTCAGVIVALGGTIPLAENLPVLDLINPERALVAVVPGVAILAGFALAGAYRAVAAVLRPWQAAAAATGLIALAAGDTYFFNERVSRTAEFNAELLATTSYLAQQPGTPLDRVLFIQEDYNLTSYTPILSGKSVTDGSQVQGAQTPPDVAALAQVPPDEAGLSRFVALASRFNVRWIVIDRQLPAGAAFAVLLAQRDLATEAFGHGRYVVLVPVWHAALVRPKGPAVLEIGAASTAVTVAALSESLDIHPERGASSRLDDYSQAALAPYGIVLLADPTIDNAAATNALVDEYVRSGGRVLKANELTPANGATSSVFEEKERRFDVTIDGTASRDVVLSMGYSPAWHASIDGVTVETHSDRGLISFAVAGGQHNIGVSYTTPAIQRVGQGISFLAWFGTIAWLTLQLLSRLRRSRNAQQA